MQSSDQSSDVVNEDVDIDSEELASENVDGESDEVDIETLQAQLEEANTKATENWDRALRMQAEMDNLRKRSQRELESAHKFGLEKFLGELLPIKDSLELGLTAAQESDGALKEGMELTLKMLVDLMTKHSISEVDPVDQPFDPELHQAMTMQPSDDVEPNTVINVVQKGYTLNGRLLRPAMVIVSKAAN